ncbi:hypothetical protein EVAR_79276_1 [Eumeta japonica]|uniref:Uncharacterized protein n=1 Tax=Eumeta variegata TaxID=151549 RepID=A0A4C1TH85_EUMVA|nr:hypothetical protein EVAR_79276_1 [Eumeta japonica]
MVVNRRSWTVILRCIDKVRLGRVDRGSSDNPAASPAVHRLRQTGSGDRVLFFDSTSDKRSSHALTVSLEMVHPMTKEGGAGALFLCDIVANKNVDRDNAGPLRKRAVEWSSRHGVYRQRPPSRVCSFVFERDRRLTITTAEMACSIYAVVMDHHFGVHEGNDALVISRHGVVLFHLLTVYLVAEELVNGLDLPFLIRS